MKSLKIKKTAICIAMLLCSTSYAQETDADGDVVGVLPVVTVTDDYYVDFDDWGGYNPFNFDPAAQQAAAIQALIDEFHDTAAEAAALHQMSSVFRKTSVCFALVSSGARWTVSTSDVTSRWLAAQEVFNYINNLSLFEQYREYTRSLTFIVDGKKYRGFKVAYADGVSESWAVLPNYATSSIKLLDQPLPNSKEPYTGYINAPKCNGES